ncbi:MAG: endopeptidase La [Brevefilum sp.]|nr:endopeptidase La [Brevefilum sp.]MDW7754275.1 endopeptidase La [Brevefilum sp.]
MSDEQWFPPSDGEEGLFGNIHQRTDELYRIVNRESDDSGVFISPAFILKDVVVFPRMISPIFISDDNSQKAIEAAQGQNKTLVALFLSDQGAEGDYLSDFLPVGIELAVGRMLSMQGGSHSALVQGRRRVEIINILQTEPYIIVEARNVPDEFRSTKRLTALMRTTRSLFESCVELNDSLPEEAHLFSMNINDPGWLADMIATSLSLPNDTRKDLMILTHPGDRLKKLNQILAEELDVLELEGEIQAQVQTEVDRSHREFYLREQMKAIQTELGEGDIWNQEIVELSERIDEKKFPEEVKSQAFRELSRLEQMPPMSPEVGIIRTYLDWLLDLPWEEESEDNLDVLHANEVLEREHYGLKKAKDRIIEYIAIRSLNPKRLRQPILCFVGPPGTGKTSLGKSIANALGRKFVRLSLGGVRDEAEIRGHRRTYIGAMPGRIIQTMRRAETSNPLFMLDEIDKLGADFRGDPSSALLEVLDPEQNNAFSDHYLEVSYDLSKVIFITTANSLSTIPPALLDRMEIIEFSGYIEEEKLEIARRFLIPRQMEENGLSDEQISFQDASLMKIIREYTYEAGVRNFEREIGSVLRKIARLKTEKKTYPKRITPQAIRKYLGPQQYFETEAEMEDEVGVATALAWTENGGEIMPVEVLILDGKGNLQITGQIGEVMQESAQAALSYIKSRAELLEIDSDIFENVDVHLHVPEGGIPKDGPSAGITITTAMISALTERPSFHLVGMTGEITLRGRVLPVGGIKEKVLASHRAGLKKVIIPIRNEKDLEDVPKSVLKEMEIVTVKHMDEVLPVALHPPKSAEKIVKRRSSKKTAPEK